MCSLAIWWFLRLFSPGLSGPLNARSGGLRPEQPKNSVIGGSRLSRAILEMAAEEIGAGPVNYSGEPSMDYTPGQIPH
jgi:hypothetical protein